MVRTRSCTPDPRQSGSCRTAEFERPVDLEHDDGGLEDNPAAVLPNKRMAFLLSAVLLPLDQATDRAPVCKECIQERGNRSPQPGLVLAENGPNSCDVVRLRKDLAGEVAHQVLLELPNRDVRTLLDHLVHRETTGRDVEEPSVLTPGHVEQSLVGEDVDVAAICRHLAAGEPWMLDGRTVEGRRKHEPLPLTARQVPRRLYESDQQLLLFRLEQHAVKHHHDSSPSRQEARSYASSATVAHRHIVVIGIRLRLLTRSPAPVPGRRQARARQPAPATTRGSPARPTPGPVHACAPPPPPGCAAAGAHGRRPRDRHAHGVVQCRAAPSRCAAACRPDAPHHRPGWARRRAPGPQAARWPCACARRASSAARAPPGARAGRTRRCTGRRGRRRRAAPPCSGSPSSTPTAATSASPPATPTPPRPGRPATAAHAPRSRAAAAAPTPALQAPPALGGRRRRRP